MREKIGENPKPEITSGAEYVFSQKGRGVTNIFFFFGKNTFIPLQCRHVLFYP
jgi:hypothetical protein